jgi:imidazole glycerol-phosphate synthase subunit HisH
MIAIVDYGLGNTSAFANLYKRLNISHRIASSPDQLDTAEKIILPGVGSFDHAMTLLNESGMRERLEHLVLQQKIPVLGICVGMQMLAHSSDEGILPGLGWIDGTVKKFQQPNTGQKLYLPHMGWNSVTPVKTSPLFHELENSPTFYFLHSYYFSCPQEESVVAVTEYGDKYASVVHSKNVYGIQCHPEKSHQNGIQLLKNFAKL